MHGSDMLPLTLRGIDPQREAAVTDVAPLLVAGQLADLRRGAATLILGEALAEQLGVTVGDAVTLLVPIASADCAAGAASAGVHGGRHVQRRHPGPRRDAGAGGARRRARLRAGGRGRQRPAAALHRRAGRAGIHAGGAQRRRPGPAGARLDAGQRQLLPRHPHREDDGGADPDADRRRRGVQHRRHAGDGRDRQAHRHRDPAHARRSARSRCCASSSRRGW